MSHIVPLLAEDRMSEPLHFDLVAIGGGFAGLSRPCEAPNWGCARPCSKPVPTRPIRAARDGPAGFFTCVFGLRVAEHAAGGHS